MSDVVSSNNQSSGDAPSVVRSRSMNPASKIRSEQMRERLEREKQQEEQARLEWLTKVQRRRAVVNLESKTTSQANQSVPWANPHEFLANPSSRTLSPSSSDQALSRPISPSGSDQAISRPISPSPSDHSATSSPDKPIAYASKYAPTSDAPSAHEPARLILPLSMATPIQPVSISSDQPLHFPALPASGEEHSPSQPNLPSLDELEVHTSIKPSPDAATSQPAHEAPSLQVSVSEPTLIVKDVVTAPTSEVTQPPPSQPSVVSPSHSSESLDSKSSSKSSKSSESS